MIRALPRVHFGLAPSEKQQLQARLSVPVESLQRAAAIRQLMLKNSLVGIAKLFAETPPTQKDRYDLLEEALYQKLLLQNATLKQALEQAGKPPRVEVQLVDATQLLNVLDSGYLAGKPVHSSIKVPLEQLIAYQRAYQLRLW